MPENGENGAGCCGGLKKGNEKKPEKNGAD
jgi:hypothetical protein